jgi:hypothetical protein
MYEDRAFYSLLHRCVLSGCRFEEEIANPRKIVGHDVAENQRQNAVDPGLGPVRRRFTRHQDASSHTQCDRWKHGHHRLSRPWRALHRPHHRKPGNFGRASGQWRGGADCDNAVCSGIRGRAGHDETSGRRPGIATSRTSAKHAAVPGALGLPSLVSPWGAPSVQYATPRLACGLWRCRRASPCRRF